MTTTDERQLGTEVVRFERNTDALYVWAPSRYGKAEYRDYRLLWISADAQVRVRSTGELGLLRWQDKLILAALFYFWNEQGRDPAGWVHVMVKDIDQLLRQHAPDRLYRGEKAKGKRGGMNNRRVKESLERLHGCQLKFVNSFFDKKTGTYITPKRFKHILKDLTIIEFNKVGVRGKDDEIANYVQAQIDLRLVSNLLMNYSRPVSLGLWTRLTERGGLWESYITGVLAGRRGGEWVRKDVFTLWDECGLSYKGMEYASRLASRMRPELEKIKDDPYSILKDYYFECSENDSKKYNLCLKRRKNAYIDQFEGLARVKEPDLFDQAPEDTQPSDFDLWVDQIRFQLGDTSPNDSNIRRIAQRFTKEEITPAITEAMGRKGDNLLQKRNAAAYFVGIMREKAKEKGVNLGFKIQAKTAPAPGKGSQSKPMKQESAHRTKRKPEQTKQRLQQKIDSYFINLSDDEKQRIQEVATLKARVLLDPESKGFNALVHDNIRRMVAERLRVEWVPQETP